jgi:hypothetical protein
VINENALRDALLALATAGRSNYLMISKLGAEVLALRETIRGLDPTFAEVLAQKRSQENRENAPIERAVVQTYDELIERLKAGEVC